MTHVHFIGIGGSGLSALAQVLLEGGFQVSGSDRALSPLARHLGEAGAQVFAGHRPENVQGADLVVRSSAVGDDNPEVQVALEAGIPVYKRSDFLRTWFADYFLAGRRTIAVAGTHGKTTTTAMIAWVLSSLGLDPSYIIGGVSANLGGNAHAGQGDLFVIEADEYDRMFLGLNPTLAVVTNLEQDHPDCYPTPQDYFDAFHEFTRRIQVEGALLACSDDAGAAGLLEIARQDGRRGLAYSAAPASQAEYTARDVDANEQGGFTFEMSAKAGGKEAAPVIVALQAPGVHNVRNALAALAVAHQLGLPLAEAAAALENYAGTGRRFELRGEAGGVTLVDDYAHHPTEIRATLAAARARYAGRRIWAVWQPHTYSRTRQLFPAFAAAFGDADQVVVTEVYAAREAPPADGFSARLVAEALTAPGGAAHPSVTFAASLEAARDALLAHLQPGDVVLVLSAGDADQISSQVYQALAGRTETGLKDH